MCPSTPADTEAISLEFIMRLGLCVDGLTQAAQ